MWTSFCTQPSNVNTMSTQNENASVNRQNHPHQEGQQNNTPPTSGSRSGENNNQPMSNMLQESDEQRNSKNHGQQDERSVQQNERQP
jgi:hypothetical protein